jgi:hypothetical protein
MKQLWLSDFTYSADDKNMPLSAMGPQLVDFINVIGLPGILKEPAVYHFVAYCVIIFNVITKLNFIIFL